MSLRILCLGDSLTEGYTRFGTVWAPYSASMKDMLEQYNEKAEAGNITVSFLSASCFFLRGSLCQTLLIWRLMR